MRTLKRTTIKHTHTAHGQRLPFPCFGMLRIEVDATARPYVVCDVCGEGYRFGFESMGMEGPNFFYGNVAKGMKRKTQP